MKKSLSLTFHSKHGGSEEGSTHGLHPTRALGSTENKSFSLKGFSVSIETYSASGLISDERERIVLIDSSGSGLCYLLEPNDNVSARRWFEVINAHTDHMENVAGTRWLF